MIITTGLYKEYGEKRIVFPDIFLDGGIHAVCGKSGCGKTTLLRLLCGLEKPSGGTCSCDLPASLDFQTPALFPWYTVRENVELVSDTETALSLLALAGLATELGTYPSELSVGMKKRVSLARAFAADSPTVLLDEPTSGLDAETAMSAAALIKEYSSGRTVLVTTHDMTLAAALDSTVYIE